MSAEGAWPRVGCGAAIIESGKLLLVRRRRAPEAGCGGLPGGKVEPFEPVAKAAAREIREELGLLIKPGGLLCLVDQIDEVAGHHWVAAVYRVDEYVGCPSIREPDALSGLEWFALDALPDSLTEVTRQAVAVLQQAI